ncbi:MAG: disulfide bond formation protein DsbB [Alphaproteobacteria bacterium]|jgi:disulfide bond formation protein DsbB
MPLFAPLFAPRVAFALLLITAAAVLGAAFASEHLGGLRPCVLCLWQRYPYAAVISLAAIGFGLARVPDMNPRGLAAIAWSIAGMLLIDAAIAGFHVGVEQHWWEGTASCVGASSSAGSAADLARQLKATPVARCDEVAFALFGISMAGYNMILALEMAGFAAAFAAHIGRQPAK